MLLAEIVTKTGSVDLSQYPRWLVLLVGTLVAAVILWILGKLLKWTIWVLIVVVVIGGVIVAGRAFLNA